MSVYLNPVHKQFSGLRAPLVLVAVQCSSRQLFPKEGFCEGFFCIEIHGGGCVCDKIHWAFE